MQRVLRILERESRRVHNAVWPETDESICSHAWREQFWDWRWRPAVLVLDLIAFFVFFERDHCRSSNETHWPW